MLIQKAVLRDPARGTILAWAGIVLLELVSLILFYLLSPSDPENSILLGLSAFRLILLAVLVFISILVGIGLWLYLSLPSFLSSLGGLDQSALFRAVLLLSSSLVGFFVFFLLVKPSFLPTIYVGYSKRIFPLLLVGLAVCLETIIATWYAILALTDKVRKEGGINGLIFTSLLVLLGNVMVGIGFLGSGFMNLWIWIAPLWTKRLTFILSGLILLCLASLSSEGKIKVTHFIQNLEEFFNNRLKSPVVILIVGGCAFLSVASQFDFLYHYSQNYIAVKLLSRHLEILKGVASIPARYRLFSDFLVEGWRLLFISAGITNYEIPAFTFRFLQNTAVFLFFYHYLRSYKLGKLASLVGVGMFCYGICMSYYNSPLAYDTYMEVLLMLMAADFASRQVKGYLLPLTVIGAFSREGTVFTPVIWFLSYVDIEARKWKDTLQNFNQRNALLGVVSLVLFFVIYIGIRLANGGKWFAGSGFGDEVHPGLALVWLNITDSQAWANLFFMYWFLPLAVLWFGAWPQALKKYLIGVAFPWFLLQFWFGTVHETRLFLLPLALVFIPAGLIVINTLWKQGLPEIERQETSARLPAV